MSGAEVIVIRQNRILKHFRRAGALEPARAVSLDELGLRRSWLLRRLEVRGVLVALPDGRYYLDGDEERRFRIFRRWMVLSVMVLALLVVVAVAVLEP